MAYTKITGNQAILAGAVLHSSPTIYAAGSYNKLSTSSTGTFQIYGVPDINNTTTDATLGGINLGGMTQYIKKIHLAAAAVNSDTTNEYGTSWNMPYGSIIEDVFMCTITRAASNTNTLTVGISGDIDGFLVGVTPTSAWTPVLASYGTLLRAAGTSDLTARVPYYSKSSTTVEVKIGRSATTFSATWTGDLFIKYLVPSS